MRRDIFDIEIKINGIEYENTLAEDLEINKGNLDQEFQEQSERYAYYGTLAELAKDKEARTKHELELLEAQLDALTRDNANQIASQNPKFKMTEAMVENQVKADPRYQAKLKEFLDSKRLAGILNVARESFQQRRDMLISLGANHRFLNGNEPRVMETKQDHAKQVMAKSAPPPVVQQPEPEPVSVPANGQTEAQPTRRRAPKPGA